MGRRKQDLRRRATAKSQAAEPGAPAGWSPRAARRPIERGEKLAIGALFVAAVALRFSYQARISIEHWDEAVNASNVLTDGGYPARFLYSPPLLPDLIELSMQVFGRTALAAVMPSLVLGACTIPLCWWVGREWFGPIAGIAAAALAALSDFQIVYSRTALTDAALGFWFLLAVYCSWRALARNRVGEALFAGAVVACAWATKYNGWLPLAVALSGFLAWGVFERFGRKEWLARLPVMAAIVIATGVCWTPVWLSLQPDGGYSAVTANHAQYFFGLGGWWSDFQRQLANQRFYEGWLTSAAMILAWLLPVVFQRLAFFSRATGDSGGSTQLSEPGSPPAPPGEATRRVLAEIGGRIDLLSVAAFLAGASLLVAWLGFCAVFAILFVAFVILAIWLRPRSADVDPDAARARNLACWLLAAWFLGLFVAIPLYKPYPRLVMPWLVCAWMTSGACVDLVLNRVMTQRAARDAAQPPVRIGWRTWAMLVVGIAVLAGGIGSRMKVSSSREVPGWQDRTLRARIIGQAAQFASKAGRGKPVFLVYGEPALFFNLALDGADPQPPLGGDFSFLGPGHKPLPQPAFLLAYAGAADFNKLIEPYKNRLEAVAIYNETPSDLVLLDTYPPADVAPGKPRPREELVLYQIKPR
jgi:dolichyl-phosphate-mannose-protein mannosyltransferase